MVRGEKSDVEWLEQECETIATHTGWKLQAVFHFNGNNAPAPPPPDVPVAPNSDKQVSDTQHSVPHISSHNGDVIDVIEPAQSLTAKDKSSGCETIIGTDSSSPPSSFLESHLESPLLEVATPQC